MSNPHTDDTFMYENRLMADLESSHYAPGWRFKESNQHSVTLTDPLVWRITHQSGPAVSRKAAADALRGIDPDVLNEQAAAEMEDKPVNPDDYVDWEEAPEWAAAWAMDDDGRAFWFENDERYAAWSDREYGLVEEAPNFNFPSTQFRKSLCIRDADEKVFDQMTLAEKMGAEDYALDEATEKALMDALDRADNVHSPSHYRSDGIKSDGGSTGYYALPDHATELRHLISHKGMSKSRGDIFKACYRLGEKDGADILYDLNKIKFFVEDLIEMHSRGESL